MTWIKTVPPGEADEELRRAIDETRALYPVEYAQPSPSVERGESEGIMFSHSLIPEALRHSFSAFAAMMSPELPLSRAQHEMIATVVSVTNRCHY
jgi:hypothetical protein